MVSSRGPKDHCSRSYPAAPIWNHVDQPPAHTLRPNAGTPCSKHKQNRAKLLADYKAKKQKDKEKQQAAEDRNARAESAAAAARAEAAARKRDEQQRAVPAASVAIWTGSGRDSLGRVSSEAGQRHGSVHQLATGGITEPKGPALPAASEITDVREQLSAELSSLAAERAARGQKSQRRSMTRQTRPPTRQSAGGPACAARRPSASSPNRSER